MNTSRNIIPLASAVVTRGQRAWGSIKATASEQRQLWRDVGEALLVGRQENLSDRAFKAWCDEMGFGDIKPDTRGDAMWLATNWSVIVTDLDLIHPHAIRKASRDAVPAPAPSPDLDLTDLLHECCELLCDVHYLIDVVAKCLQACW